MFKFLRSQAKVFYWVIAGSFILFLFLGGMTGRGCQAPGSNSIEPGIVGSVNGDKITAQQYDFAVRQQVSQMRQQGGNQELNANQYAIAETQAWDALIRNLIIEQAIADRKIKVDDEEVLAVFQNNPPMEILNQFRDESGNVDMNAYYSALQDPANDWTSAENYIRTILPRQKLNDEIAGLASVTDEELREEYIRQTGRAVAEYMGATFADLGDGYEPTDDEIAAWYSDHQDDYRVDTLAKAQVVRFAKTPSEADYADVLLDIQAIREEILSGAKDFAVAASEYSEDPGSAARGGDLGRFDRNRMVAPLTAVAFELPVGEVSEPVKTKFGYHLIEVTDRSLDSGTGEVYEVEARHILLKVQPGPDTLDLIRQSAENFRLRVTGENFATTAEAEALDLVSPEPFPAGRDIPSVALSLRGSQWAFGADAGEVSRIFENRDFYYIVLAEGTIPGGTRPLDEVKGQVSLAVRKEHNLAAAKAKLAPAVGEVQLGKTMAEVASAYGLAHAVTDTFTANGNVDGVGYGTDFNLKVITGTVGRLIPEIPTLRGVFAATPLWIAPVDQADFDQRQAGLRAVLMQRAQGEVINKWFDDQIAAAEIVDNRYRTR